MRPPCCARCTIRDFVIVEKADIHFGAGFIVFSGETGAGKSILIDALALTLGERAGASVLREGAARTDVSAVFDTPAHLRDLAGGTRNRGRRRTCRCAAWSSPQGRSRAFINGVPATVAQLRELGDSLVDIHGQHAHQSLMRPDAQRDLLDAQGGHGELRQAVAQAWKRWRQLAQAAGRRPNATAPAGGLNASACNGRSMNWTSSIPVPANGEALQAEHTRLAHAQSLLDGASRMLQALDGDDESAHSRVVAAVHVLEAAQAPRPGTGRRVPTNWSPRASPSPRRSRT